jgi:hypothetical protein
MGHCWFWILKRVAAGGREPWAFRSHLRLCERYRGDQNLARAMRW